MFKKMRDTMFKNLKGYTRYAFSLKGCSLNHCRFWLILAPFFIFNSVLALSLAIMIPSFSIPWYVVCLHVFTFVTQTSLFLGAIRQHRLIMSTRDLYKVLFETFKQDFAKKDLTNTVQTD